MSEPNSPLASSTFELYRPVEVFVAPPPPRLKRRYWLHALLLLLTVLTTLIVGARLQYNFDHNLPAFLPIPDRADLLQSTFWWFPAGWVLTKPSRLLLGIPFSVTVLLILLAHEMGHFLYCVRYGVWATLPFFIPAPTLIGTFGAFIRIRSPIRSRAALFDIGIAGPIAGFVVGLVVLVLALTFSKPMTSLATGSGVALGYPLVFDLLRSALSLVMPAGSHVHSSLRQVYLHPTAIAAWVGMFATALNLLPGGQLDGGHIIYSIAPRFHRWVSIFTVGLLLPLAYFCWPGWFVWSLLLMVTGMRHPQVPAEPGIGTKRKLLAIFAAIMLLLTFIPAPLGIAGMFSLLR
jgi:membrane-associated protease RseP (regulator of RpoE activity)